MYNGSTEFDNLISTPGGNSVITRLTFADFSINKFTKLEYYGGSNNSDDIAIGTTNMAYLDVSTITDRIITNQEFLFEVGMELSDGTIEYAPMGYFTVQKPDGDEDTISFTAYDRMQKFEKPYFSALAYPTNSTEVLNELCSMCGVELATPIANPITITDKLEGYTCREVLGYIAGIHGYFACIDRYGKLNLRWYSATPIEKQIGLIWSLTKAQSNYTVEKITLAKDSETTYTSGTGISGINYSNPYATQAIADSIYASLGNFTYRPCEISMLDDIRLDPWDMIKVTYLDGSVLTIPVMALEHSFTSGETRVKSVGKTDTENEYSYSGPVTQAMDRMATEILVANRVIATKVDAEYVQAHAITTDNISAIEAEIKNAVIEEVSAEYADIRLANIDTANIDVANIGLLFTKVGLIDRATIVDGHITGYLDAVEINANNITAGTLIADRILLKGSESGLLYALNNLGEVASTAVDTLDGNIITQHTVTADKLIANSITANELDVINIFGNSAVLSTLTSQTAFINAISTNSVVVGADNKAQGIIDNIYTPNTTTVDGGKITTGSITANKINVTDLSAITANLGTVTAGQITVSSTAWIPPTYDDAEKLADYIQGTTTLTEAQKTAFDFDSNGTLDLWDFAYLKAYLLKGKALPSTYIKTPSTVNINIQPAAPDKCIEITGTNSYGSAIDVYFGLTGTNVTRLTATSVQTGGLSVTDEAEISGKLSVGGAIHEGGTALIDKYAAKSQVLPNTGGRLDGQLWVVSGRADKISPANQDIRIDGIVGDATVSGAPGIGFHQPNIGWASIKYFDDAFKFINWQYTGFTSIVAHNGTFTGEVAEENQALSTRYARLSSMPTKSTYTAPTSTGGNNTAGYIRFPNIGMQLCWSTYTVNCALNRAWNSIYLGGTSNTPVVVSPPNWAATFSSMPVVFASAHSWGNGAVGVIKSGAGNSVSTTSPGSWEIWRTGALATAHSYTVTVFGIGPYS